MPPAPAAITETRLFLLLQALGWMAHFARTGGLAGCPMPNAGTDILELSTAAAEARDAADPAMQDDPAAAAESILSTTATDRAAAARGALASAMRHADHTALFTAARRLVFTRATDKHDYKYPAAAFEDMTTVSPRWRPHMIAASMLHVPAPGAPESQVIQRAREAVAGL
jgi:hypothetical protein